VTSDVARPGERVSPNSLFSRYVPRVRTSRPGVLGLLILLGAVTGCTGDADRAEPVSADVAVPSYAAPPGAPHFCTTLAGSTRILGIPRAVGALSAGTGTADAKLELTGGIDDLRAVLDEVRAEDGHERLESAVERLVDTLAAVRDRPLTAAARAGVSADLDAVGRHVQPVCQLPS
jgi:hypothetical protein